MDEFLELNEKYKNIQEFLKDKSFNHCQSIKINWLMSINGQALYYENKTLQQRIQTFRYNDTANLIINNFDPKPKLFYFFIYDIMNLICDIS